MAPDSVHDFARITGEAASDTTTIDDFEDGDYSEYGGDDNGGFDVTKSQPRSGDYSLEMDGDGDGGSNHNIESLDGEGLPAYPEKGDTFRFHVYFSADTTPIQLRWAIDSHSGGGTFGGDQYAWVIHPGDDEIRLLEFTDGDLTEIGSSDTDPIPTGEWLEARIDWRTNGDINLYLYDSNESEIGSLSVTDDTHSHVGVGFFLNDDGDTSTPVYIDDIERIE